MTGGHSHPSGLLHEGDSVAHRLPPETKVVAALVFIVAVVATPRHQVWAFAAYAAVALALVAVVRLPVVAVLRRMRIEVPFLVFAVLLPVIGRGPRTEVLGLSLSEEGLWAGWNIAAKGTLGVLAAVVLSSTTPPVELLRGVERLRAPRLMVAIAGFMIRYLDVLLGEVERMRIARVSRGDDPRWLWQARATAATAGTMFVRSYERGERVHLAMLARGYAGAMPEVHHHHADRRAWAIAAVAPALAVGVALVALLR